MRGSKFMFHRCLITDGMHIAYHKPHAKAEMKAVTTAVCLLAVLLPCIAAQGLTWSRVPADGGLPAPRQAFAFGYDPLSNRLIVFGGATASGAANDTWIFDVESGNWSEVRPTEAPEGRMEAFFGVVRVDGESLFVVSHGFSTAGPGEYANVWAFRFNTSQWSRIYPGGEGPGPRYGGHFGAAYGDSNTLWVGGGFTATTPLATRYIDTYKLVFSNFTAATWEEVYPQPSVANQFRPFAPHGRCLHMSAAVGNAGLVIAGGCMRGGTGGGPCPTDDTWFFNDTTRSWRELPRCITPRTWGAMAALTNNPGLAVLYGGNDVFSRQLLQVARYPEDELFIINVAENQWKRYRVNATDYPWKRYRFAMAAARNGQIYMFGGRNLSNNALLNDLWLLSGDPADIEDVPCNNVWFSFAHFHGILMFLAFGLLFPAGVSIAQFYRCKRSKVWFISHVFIQITAALLAIAGFVMIFAVSERAGQVPTHPHAIIGILLMFFMLIQPINGIFRPHIKEDGDKSTYRVCWEWFHRIYGLFVITLGFAQVSLGVFLIVPPRAVWITWLVICGFWVGHFVVGNIVRVIYCFLCHHEPRDEDLKNGGHELKNKHL